MSEMGSPAAVPPVLLIPTQCVMHFTRPDCVVEKRR